MNEVEIFLGGIILGIIFMYLIMTFWICGNLNITSSGNDSPSKWFFEFKKGPEFIDKQRYVVLRVIHRKNSISQDEESIK